MDAPKCKLCGENHWTSVCPKFQSWEAKNCKPLDRLEGPPPSPELVAKLALNRPIEPDTKFDRVAYQREYMRKRRAQKP